MAVSSFEDLREHRGHTIKVVTYGNPAQNIAIECISCSEVLVSFDKEEKVNFKMPEMTDDAIEMEYNSDVCCWGCNHCGNWIACDYGDMREHLEDCEEFQKHIMEKKDE